MMTAEIVELVAAIDEETATRIAFEELRDALQVRLTAFEHAKDRRRRAYAALEESVRAQRTARAALPTMPEASS